MDFVFRNAEVDECRFRIAELKYKILMDDGVMGLIVGFPRR